MKNLKENEISKIATKDNDFYIIKHLGYEEPRPYTFDEISQQLRNMVLQEKQQKALQDWIEKLKKEIYVEKF